MKFKKISIYTINYFIFYIATSIVAILNIGLFILKPSINLMLLSGLMSTVALSSYYDMIKSLKYKKKKVNKWYYVFVGITLLFMSFMVVVMFVLFIQELIK